MTLLSEITAADWQPELNTDSTVVQGLDDIGQCVEVILLTPLGSDPHRPDFGSNLHLYVDWPQNRIVPHLVREAHAAIFKWEPRIGSITVAVSFAEAAVVVVIQWSGVAGDTGTAAVTLGTVA